MSVTRHGDQAQENTDHLSPLADTQAQDAIRTYPTIKGIKAADLESVQSFNQYWGMVTKNVFAMIHPIIRAKFQYPADIK
jgi:hypothetical protein